jgi:hypothetical protein
MGAVSMSVSIFFSPTQNSTLPSVEYYKDDIFLAHTKFVEGFHTTGKERLKSARMNVYQR